MYSCMYSVGLLVDLLASGREQAQLNTLGSLPAHIRENALAFLHSPPSYGPARGRPGRGSIGL